MTNETIDIDGWCHTGDIAQVLPENRAIQIIDRKKNIFKLSHGEYIAPERIESLYVLSPFIAQAFVYGDPYYSYCVGVIVPNQEFVMPWIQKQSFKNENMDFKQAC